LHPEKARPDLEGEVVTPVFLHRPEHRNAQPGRGSSDLGLGNRPLLVPR